MKRKYHLNFFKTAGFPQRYIHINSYTKWLVFYESHESKSSIESLFMRLKCDSSPSLWLEFPSLVCILLCTTKVWFKECLVDSFWTNPQFRVRIEELDKECASGQCPENILVSLMQIHENRYRSLVSNYYFGFNVYLVSINNNSTRLRKSHWIQ